MAAGTVAQNRLRHALEMYQQAWKGLTFHIQIESVPPLRSLDCERCYHDWDLMEQNTENLVFLMAMIIAEFHRPYRTSGIRCRDLLSDGTLWPFDLCSSIA